MTAGDRLIEHGADRLEEAAERFRTRNGWKAKLAAELAEDAAFLRKLKPSLIAARARGQAPPEQPAPAQPAPAQPAPEPLPPEQPPPEPRVRPQAAGRKGGGGPNPLVIAAAAFLLGVLLAKAVDWRSHAHPRD